MTVDRVRQSDLNAFSRCPRQKWYEDQSRAGLAPPRSQLSRTVYGTCVHHALQVYEQLRHEGRTDALEVALATFEFYWNPEHTGDLPGTQPVDTWLPRDTYGGMLLAGRQAIRDYAELLSTDNSQLLALELTFTVPVDLSEYGLGWRELTGTVDRLSVRKTGSKKYLSLDDFKTGVRPTYLRYAVQWSVYAYASLQREFWDQFGDSADEWWRGTIGWARRGRWIDMKKIKHVDAGWRGPIDYERMKLAVAEYIKSCEAGIYPLSLSGATCTFCQWNQSCGGIPVPDEDEGKP